MSEDEIEIEPENEDYEIVPLSPIRKLEKRIEEVEQNRRSGNMEELMRELMDLVKSNQHMVDEIVKADNELRNELEKIPEKINEVTEQWNEFLEVLKSSSGAEMGGGASPEMAEKLDKLIEQNSALLEKNEEIVDSIKSLKKRTSSRSRSSGGSFGQSGKSPRLRIKRGGNK
ncbi:MAG: hypothetical protein ACLFS3_03285 [Candidatus Aenigmatarchaeota archaeon]